MLIALMTNLVLSSVKLQHHRLYWSKPIPSSDPERPSTLSYLSMVRFPLVRLRNDIESDTSVVVTHNWQMNVH